MKIFDFNIHLPTLLDSNVNLTINQDLILDKEGVINGFLCHKQKIKRCSAINILLFNSTLFNTSFLDVYSLFKNEIEIVKLTALIDFRQKDVFDYIDKLVANGVSAILFNSYLQKITDNDFLQILEICKYAQNKKLIICIDGSYGTSKMYEYENLKLACFISDHIVLTQIVIVHGGSCNVIKAMLLAAEKNNVWLDTSFSLPYYINSSIEQDFSFAIKKLNFSRIIYGSDHPYVDLNDAISIHNDFFKKYNFTENQIEKIMYNNSLELFNVR